MQASASPTKRRAVLGSLDANAAMSSSTPAKKVVVAVVAREEEQQPPPPPPLLLLTPSRGAEEDDGGEEQVVDESPAAKKACVDGSTRSSSPSVETSSLFDSSTITTATTATEPIIPTTRPRALTREQAREKAEILRLRLGLAGYKLRTGQTSVPLSELQRKPLPPSTTTAATNIMRRRANTSCTSTEHNTSIHSRVKSAASSSPLQVSPGLSQESSTLSSTGFTNGIVTVPASSQESVVAETRGNTPERDRDHKGGLQLLGVGGVDSPSRMFQSSPVPAPVSSLRSTCA
ncbi:hypothetical protein BBK36DRAFT_1200785 [Trichoderma citrinoviride]|uniref:Uncharacterized protein n=1 Tax=Trichoderma citrinoviride TaxID=58853 RepID=A0A2T4BAM7_9HYPO|nr:hypothetical protein BBK36DRAFT_1200785 [Trichoderma citrinoviride]PTB66338.1 hypothetical protein BBK36DRAFT_1200785 [Trichoderma citrinoviride]